MDCVIWRDIWTLYDIMVHYNPQRGAAQTPPPICPKCGSHRTEIVGRSANTDFAVVRCNACGERSLVKLNDADEKVAAPK